jgi:hypothetical protein
MNLTPPDAAKYLTERGVKLSAASLGTYRCRGTGPAYIRVGRWPRYPVAALDAYIARITSPLIDPAAKAEPAEATP